MPTAPTLKRLVAISILYMIVALTAGVVAIAKNLPAAYGSSSMSWTARQDFIYGMGTALSPPLYSLVIQLALAALTPRSDGWGMLGVIGFVVMGSFTFIGALSAPIRNQVFNPDTFDFPKAAIMTGMILLPLFIVAFGILEWTRRRRA
jgi:hypothetical protein